jgi:hypothetical protein
VNIEANALWKLPSGPLLRAGTCAVLLTLCACQLPSKQVPMPGSARASLDARLQKVFTNSVLYKPQPTSTGSLAFKLAPLILWELDSSAGETNTTPFGRVTGHALPMTRPVVYTTEGEVTLHGQSHAQLTYFWVYPKSGHANKLSVEGIRLTLDSAGQPVIWEVLSENAESRTTFVAESLEEAARNQYGTPLPERRYSVEGRSTSALCPMVARLVDNSSVPMGPMIYLQAQPRMITTVLCRCMPAQVKSVTTTAYYELLPEAALEALSTSGHMSFGNSSLEHCLRLPTTF